MATMIEKILGGHSGQEVKPGDIVDVAIDVRAARDFGGANVVQNLQNHGLSLEDPSRTFFTFDCNPGGSDQKYATNQHICRRFAREEGLKIFDIQTGIGTHLAIDEGLVGPGETFVSTDSHANIMGAIGAFGQGMGDQDIAAAFANGKSWFKVPKSMKVIIEGKPGPHAQAKDIVLALLEHFGAHGLLGYAAEFYGELVDELNVAQRITIASMATEMGGIAALFPPNQAVIDHCKEMGAKVEPAYADEDATYDKVVHVNLDGLEPRISRPGHPEDVVKVDEVAGRKVDSCFIGSCTNGRYEDMVAAAEILKDRKVAPGVVLKIVPSTDKVWRRLLDEGLMKIFKEAGALVGNAGCAGCAAGQIGQNGPGEVTVSTGNRNYAGKQGKGEVYLASPATVAASAVAGVICRADKIPAQPEVFKPTGAEVPGTATESAEKGPKAKPTKVRGRAWAILVDNIDTDMIFHNRYLTITDQKEMGQYTFDNLEGWEDFAKKAEQGDLVFVGANFGAGSSRQQAVDCFPSVGVNAVVAHSFGAIYERNAMNAGFPIVLANWQEAEISDGDDVEIDFMSGEIVNHTKEIKVAGQPFPEVQLQMYQRGGLLAR